MIRIILAALVVISMAAPSLAAPKSNRSRATIKVHVPKKRGPKYYQGNYNPNKGRPQIRRETK